jgi:hypothetical protein
MIKNPELEESLKASRRLPSVQRIAEHVEKGMAGRGAHHR